LLSITLVPVLMQAVRARPASFPKHANPNQQGTHLALPPEFIARPYCAGPAADHPARAARAGGDRNPASSASVSEFMPTLK